MPYLAFLFQLLIHLHRAGLGSTADSKLHGQGGKTKQEQAENVHKHKTASAVLPCHPRELPYIAAADGTTCAEKNKSQPASEFFTIIHVLYSYPAIMRQRNTAPHISEKL